MYGVIIILLLSLQLYSVGMPIRIPISYQSAYQSAYQYAYLGTVSILYTLPISRVACRNGYLDSDMLTPYSILSPCASRAALLTKPVFSCTDTSISLYPYPKKTAGRSLLLLRNYSCSTRLLENSKIMACQVSARFADTMHSTGSRTS